MAENRDALLSEMLVKLIEEKKKDKQNLKDSIFDTEHIRQDEELFQQISFLGKLKEMAALQQGKFSI